MVLTLITRAFSSPKDNQSSAYQQHRVNSVAFGLLQGGRAVSHAFLSPVAWSNDNRSLTTKPENAFSCWWMRSMKMCGLYSVIQPLSSSSVSRPALALPHLTALDKSQKWLFHWPVYQCVCCSPSARFWKVIISKQSCWSPYTPCLLHITFIVILF